MRPPTGCCATPCVARRFGILMADGQALSMVGIAEHLRGRSQRAGRLLAASRQVKGAKMHNGFRSATSALLYLVYLPQVRTVLGPDEARRARAEGQAMMLDEAMAYALEGLDANPR
jgi:hypothetical protein